MSLFIGVDVGGTTVKGALVDLEGSVAERIEVATDTAGATSTTVEVVRRLHGSATASSEGVAAVGVGAAGFIDAASGTVTFSPNITYDDPKLADAVRREVDLPVVVDNDANAAAWGERAFGAARGLDHVAVITVGTGIGSGMIVDGRLLRGSTGAGAEFGHMVIIVDGEPCTCGLKGCLERYASGSAIARMAGGEGITAEQVAGAAHAGDRDALSVMRSAGEALGVGMCNLVNLLDPDAIVLAGSVVGAGEPFLGPARTTLDSLLAAQRRRPMRCIEAALGQDAGIVGAAALAMDILERSDTP